MNGCEVADGGEVKETIVVAPCHRPGTLRVVFVEYVGGK